MSSKNDNSNQQNKNNILSEAIAINRTSRNNDSEEIFEDLIKTLESMDYEDLHAPDDPLVALNPPLQEAYMDMGFGIFDSNVISKCKRVVYKSDDEEDESDSEEKEIAAVAVRPFANTATPARRRSGARRGSQPSPPPIEVPTFKNDEDIEQRDHPRPLTERVSSISTTVTPAQSERPQARARAA